MSQKPPQPKITRHSTCLCNSVQITVTGVDKGAVLCHCSNCQRASGSSFAHNYRFLKSDLTFDKGEDLVREYADSNTKTGNTLFRHFCGKCVSLTFYVPVALDQRLSQETDRFQGCPLYMRNSAFEGLTILHTGSMQDRTQPSMELFKENKHAWIGDVTSQSKL